MTIDNLVLPKNTILVLPDEGDKPTTGTIFRHSEMGGARFHDADASIGGPTENTHVLFVKEMTTDVKIDGVDYLAMHENAVVGLIPD